MQSAEMQDKDIKQGEEAVTVATEASAEAASEAAVAEEALVSENEAAPEANIKVSVIVPIYNAEAYLRPALDSILDQTLREIEIICVDDGSTDGSLKIIKEYQKKDARIRIVTQNNAGPGSARNNGMRRSRGEYVSFLDADDFFDANFLEKMYETVII